MNQIAKIFTQKAASQNFILSGYTVALLTVAITVSVRLFLTPLIGNVAPLMLFFIPIILSARYGGMISGVLATILSLIACKYFWLSSLYTLTINNSTDLLIYEQFLGIGLIISWLIEQLYKVNNQSEISIEKKVSYLKSFSKSEQLFRDMVDNLPTMVWISGNDTSAKFLNKPWLDFTGCTLEEQLGTGWIENLHPEDLQQCWNNYIAAFNAQENFQVEYRLKRFDGEYRWIVAIGMPQFDENGTFAGYIGSCLDITERKQAEDKLRESEQRLRLAMAAAKLGIWDWNINTNMVRWSDNMESIYDLKPNTFDQTLAGFLKIVHPEDLEFVTSTINTAIELGEDYYIEHRNLCSDGSVKWKMGKGNIIKDKNGNLLGLFGVAMDITERKQAEENRLLLEKEKEISQLKMRFFSMASHEFRTPISTILLSTQVLKKAGKKCPEEKRIKNLDRIEDCTKHMRQLITDILLLNRAEGGNLAFNPEKTNIEEFCRNLVEEFRLISDDQHIINFAYHGSYHNVNVDPKLLRSLLSNLLENALKYSPKGGNIDLIVKAEESEIIFTVSDNGIGIKSTDKDQIFAPFYRSNSVKNISGSGLGLTIVKKCVDLHKGNIIVDSDVDMGTKIVVKIPRVG